MKKTIGILAHVDAGKTTFSEQILYNTNSIRIRGRVDHKNSFLDSHTIERERGITIFSEQAIFEFKDSTYYLVDTPGHIDFSTEMERAISVLDYAIIVISAVESIQSHTENIWTLLREYNVPTIFFINKIDREGANIDNVLNDIKLNLSKDIIYIDEDLNNDSLKEKTIECISEYDDELLEKYLDNKYNKEVWINKFRQIIKENRIFPCFFGSALFNNGVEEFLNNLDYITETDYITEGDFSGIVYKVRHDKSGNRITFLKALNGNLKVKDEIKYNINNSILCEKVNEIRLYSGSKYKVVDSVSSGDVFAITGISSAACGQVIGNIDECINFKMVPTLTSKVIFNSKYNVKDILHNLKVLESEDPSLNIVWNEPLKEIHVHIMGIIQIEILKEVFKERFNIEIDFGDCEILYKETVSKPVMGYGHFEPLKHYAEVHLLIEPLDRNSGIVFESKCSLDNLSKGHQNLVRSHLFEREHNGILTGSSITDLKITLINGRDHNKHTNSGDFREATFRALRQGLEKSESILLEPYYKFKITIDSEYIGAVLSDIQKFNGIFNPPQINGNKAIILGRGPVCKFMGYSITLLAFTKGKGNISLLFDGYDICQNSEEVINKIDYNKDADINYSSTSIFCSKGQSYLITWDKVEDEMHCEILK